MSTDAPSTIAYGRLMHQAMRGLIQTVLSDVAAEGLPGEHHFFITFDTNHPEVEMADWLRERYADEMTIVIQHWFDALVVTDEGFSITLNFGDSPEALAIPFDAISTFVDPSVEFGLRFETQGESDPDDDPSGMAEMVEPEEEPEPAPEGDVVQLDAFRKP